MLDPQTKLIPEADAYRLVMRSKLWERIGRPHGQFRFWVAHYIKPRIPNEEISPLGTVGLQARR